MSISLHMVLVFVFFFNGDHFKVMSNSCDTMDCSLPGSSVHGILEARKLEWVPISFSREKWLKDTNVNLNTIKLLGKAL